MRYKTERMEGVEKGFAKLVGADTDKIIQESSLILQNAIKTSGANPYGDGKASQRIEKIIRKVFNG